jgi:hypothetical protein
LIQLRQAMAENTALSRAHAVTGKQLSNAVDALAGSIQSMPGDVTRWSLKILEIVERANHVADLAQTIAHDLGPEACSSITSWGEATKACAESHLRDAKNFLPWLRLGTKDLAAIFGTGATAGSTRSPEWLAIEKALTPDATLASVPDTMDALARELASYRSTLTNQSAESREHSARVGALIQAIAESAKEARFLHQRHGF